MQNVTLTGKPSDLKRVNLTRYVSLIARYKHTQAYMQVVAFPSEAYLNTDGTVSVSSRRTETGFSRAPKYKTFIGVTASGETEVITFN